MEKLGTPLQRVCVRVCPPPAQLPSVPLRFWKARRSPEKRPCVLSEPWPSTPWVPGEPGLQFRRPCASRPPTAARSSTVGRRSPGNQACLVGLLRPEGPLLLLTPSLVLNSGARRAGTLIEDSAQEGLLPARGHRPQDFNGPRRSWGKLRLLLSSPPNGSVKEGPAVFLEAAPGGVEWPCDAQVSNRRLILDR